MQRHSEDSYDFGIFDNENIDLDTSQLILNNQNDIEVIEDNSLFSDGNKPDEDSFIEPNEYPNLSPSKHSESLTL